MNKIKKFVEEHKKEIIFLNIGACYALIMYTAIAKGNGYHMVRPLYENEKDGRFYVQTLTGKIMTSEIRPQS